VPDGEASLVDKILALDEALEEASIGHAFGGALALAFYTREPRATADIDLNIFLEAVEVAHVLGALPFGVAVADGDEERARQNDQVRLWWGRTPVDLFFEASPFHLGVAERAVQHRFGDSELPFLAANDLAVFKALFDRPKDWLDIEAMFQAGALDQAWIVETLTTLVGDDRRVSRAQHLGSASP
jgi:pimeloyl-ACP methyl ester carboxylesterase